MAFDLKTVEAEIAGTPFARQVKHFTSVGSTNLLALEAAQNGAQYGVWVADEQTAGRGRGGHAWHSVAGGDGLYVSALVTASLVMTRALWISLAAGLAAKTAIHEIAQLEIDIRWPNDLMIRSRKCGGILVETAMAPAEQGKPAMLRYAVIGVGINLNQTKFPEEIARLATSLKLASGRSISREQLMAALLRQLHSEMQMLIDDFYKPNNDGNLLQRFAGASTWVRGKRVRVEESGGYTGVTAGLDDRGFLIVDGDDGTKHTVLSGGVREL